MGVDTNGERQSTLAPRNKKTRSIATKLNSARNQGLLSQCPIEVEIGRIFTDLRQKIIL